MLPSHALPVRWRATYNSANSEICSKLHYLKRNEDRLSLLQVSKGLPSSHCKLSIFHFEASRPDRVRPTRIL